MKKITAALAAFLLLLPTVLPVSAVEYFPNVTAEMERPAYWSERQEDASAILAAPEEIARLNQEILAAEGTNLADLKSLPEEALERIAGARETDGGPETERAVTREELAVALWQAAKALQAEPAVSSRKSTADCADAETVDSWAREAVEWALNEGLLYGTSPDIIGPRENATRAQLAVVLTRWCERFGLPEKGVSD